MIVLPFDILNGDEFFVDYLVWNDFLFHSEFSIVLRAVRYSQQHEF